MAAKRMPWYRWYHVDWRLSDSRADLNLAERGLFRDLLDIHYADGSIPADPKILAKMIGVEDPDEFAAAWGKVSLRFKPHRTNPLRLVNKRAAKICKEIATYRQAQGEIARVAAKERRKKKKQNELDPEATLRLPSANPQASESDTESDTEIRERTSLPLPPLQIEPVNREPGYEPGPGFDRFRVIARRKSELAWKGDEPGRAWAEVVTSSAIEAQVFQGFERWSESKRWTDGIFSNWHNWIRNLDFTKTPEGSKTQLSALGKVLHRVREANAN